MVHNLTIPWYSCSPDFTPLDFFFRGVVKDIVYWEKVQNVNEVPNRIIGDAKCVTNEVLANAW
jgi:hypothetical protein